MANKTKTYYQPYHKGTKILAFEIPSFMAFASREDCKHFLRQGNPFYRKDRYEIVEYHNEDIEGVTILDKNGNIVEINE